MPKTSPGPAAFPPADLDWRRLLPPACRANAALARYDALLQSLENPAALTAALALREAAASGALAGYAADLRDILEYSAGIAVSAPRRPAVDMALSHSAALDAARRDLAARPLSPDLIKTLGQRLTPGPARTLPPGLKDWLAYVNSDADDAVLQAGIALAGFEALHPHPGDGGRMGRMLATLSLYQRRALSWPLLPLAESFLAERDLYQARLAGVAAPGGWQAWLEFFLEAAADAAERARDRLRQLHDLYQDMGDRFAADGSPSALATRDAIFTQPILSTADLRRLAGFPNRIRANAILTRLTHAGLTVRLYPSLSTSPAIYAAPGVMEVLGAG